MISKATVKYIQSLRDRKERDATGLFVAEGPKLVNDLLSSSKLPVREIYATSDWLFGDKYNTTLVTGEELGRISSNKSPNTVLAIFEKPESTPVQAAGNITLVLDTIQDPGNLGTIIRTADWFGVKDIVCSHETADAFNPKVIQSTMASIASVNVLYTDLVSWLSSVQVKKFAATLGGKPIQPSIHLDEAIIMIGNESKGIRPELLALADEKIMIPRIGTAESLNAAIATAVILYAFTS